MVIAAPGHGWALAMFPLAAAVIAVCFAAVLARRFARARRPYEGAWAVALLMYAVASFAMFLAVAGGWDGVEYRLYWLLGAALNVPFLALGELYLLDRSGRVANAGLVVLLLISAGSVAIASDEPLSASALREALPLGREAWGSDSAAYQLRWLSWIGYIGLLAGIVWSALRMSGRPELKTRAAGILLIGLGATLVAVGSGVGAGFGLVALFSVSLAVGVAVMFGGFLIASRSRSVPIPGNPDAPS